MPSKRRPVGVMEEDGTDFEAAPAGISPITDGSDDLASTLLRMVSSSVAVLQLLQEASEEEHNSIRARLEVLKGIVNEMPIEPVNKTSMRQRTIGFQPAPKRVVLKKKIKKKR
jgi:hypothetical protein